jgi:hypothetical protein
MDPFVAAPSMPYLLRYKCNLCYVYRTNLLFYFSQVKNKPLIPWSYAIILENGAVANPSAFGASNFINNYMAVISMRDSSHCSKNILLLAIFLSYSVTRLCNKM